VWISEDGISWSLLPNDERPLGGDDVQWITAVTVGGPGLVAVGAEHPTDSPLGFVAVIWTSVDGMSWSKISPSELGSDVEKNQTFMFVDVTAGGPGLVAIGAAYNSRGICQLCGGAVWTSVDGITWDRAPIEPALLDAIEAVASGETGLVVVGGHDHAWVWTSPDGLAWSPVPHDETVFGGVGSQRMLDVVAAGPGYVAVGDEEPDIHSPMGGIRAAVWTSPDGLTWTRVPHDPEVFGGEAGDEQSMTAVAAVGSDLIAVGSSVWLSPDGTTWSRVHEDPALTAEGAGGINDLAVGESAVVAVGTDPGDVDEDESMPVAWVAPFAG